LNYGLRLNMPLWQPFLSASPSRWRHIASLLCMRASRVVGLAAEQAITTSSSVFGVVFSFVLKLLEIPLSDALAVVRFLSLHAAEPDVLQSQALSTLTPPVQLAWAHARVFAVALLVSFVLAKVLWVFFDAIEPLVFPRNVKVAAVYMVVLAIAAYHAVMTHSWLWALPAVMYLTVLLFHLTPEGETEEV